MAANFFRQRREELDLTQREIAEAFDPQMTPASVSAWETNVAAPSMDLVDDLARIYRVSESKIIDAIRAIWAARRKNKATAGKE